ncbi:GPR4 protein, partial [Polypterus senegalus]|nr:GPR4 protein [Polypterus senegalus]
MDSNKTCFIDFSSDQTGLTVIYSIVFTLGFPANLLSMWGLYQLLRTSNFLNTFILNLLVSDCLQLLTLPMWIIYLQNNHKWTYGRAACDFVGFLFYINLYASIVFLSIVALDRYTAIVYPFRFNKVRTARMALGISLGVWLIIFLLILTGLYPSVYDDAQELCLENYPVRKQYAIFKIGTIVFGFVLPIFILGFTSVKIRSALRSSPSVTQGERRRIMGILCTITLIFVVVFGPYHLVGTYKFFSYFFTADKCLLEQKLFLVYRFCYGLTGLNNVLDPLFYIFICDDIRRQLWRSISCLMQRRKSLDSGVHLNEIIEHSPE